MWPMEQLELDPGTIRPADGFVGGEDARSTVLHPRPRVKTPPARRGPRIRRTAETDEMEQRALERVMDPDA